MYDHYIQNYKLYNYMLRQKKAWTTSTSFKGILLISKRLAQGGTVQCNCHLLILNGDGFHVSLEAIEHAQKFGLDMFTII